MLMLEQVLSIWQVFEVVAGVDAGVGFESMALRLGRC